MKTTEVCQRALANKQYQENLETQTVQWRCCISQTLNKPHKKRNSQEAQRDSGENAKIKLLRVSNLSTP